MASAAFLASPLSAFPSFAILYTHLPLNTSNTELLSPTWGPSSLSLSFWSAHFSPCSALIEWLIILITPLHTRPTPLIPFPFTEREWENNILVKCSSAYFRSLAPLEKITAMLSGLRFITTPSSGFLVLPCNPVIFPCNVSFFYNSSTGNHFKPSIPPSSAFVWVYRSCFLFHWGSGSSQKGTSPCSHQHEI